ncbi:uncharacterized protein LOC132746429 [Ruditapes philippinarum]|uniref:uncharacterized protein LOC132746429 n=1 Tax=Ruditapes philippinarum TaxID=129788 RepID=UPI00295B0AFA|nr:uncharacterized protein LOC132746429 [Ruditapes philippinarum]XP_060591542.1 uncharacterized protein LOC132746429 [Ruditapes philippinarum]
MEMSILMLGVMVSCVTHITVKASELDAYDQQNATTNCSFKVWEQSKNFYESRLIALKPNFMHFTLELGNYTYNSTPGIFRPLHWVWTYSSPTVSYPYLAWNIDHGLLSFSLLDVKTVVIPFVKLIVENKCDVNFGTFGTTYGIVKALSGLITNMSNEDYHRYEESYFCYLAEAPGIRERMEYYAALYLLYPISFLNYNCCVLWYSYFEESYIQNCTNEQPSKWEQCKLGPYILGIIIFMYFPILLLDVCAWLSKDEHIIQHNVELTNEMQDGYEPLDNDEKDWVYLNGNPPLTMLESFSFLFCGMNRNHPVLVSRIRRVICILLAPCVVFIQIVMYSHGIGTAEAKITVNELVNFGMPMGFLSLLADRKDRIKVFAPLFGGPVCLLIMYYILALVFLVFPRSLKQIVERGMPDSNIPSPFFLHVDEIIKLSMLSETTEPGYKNAALACKCSIYMLFNTMFWERVLEIQKERFCTIPFNTSRLICSLKVIVFPFYLLFCFLEIILCIVFYALPVFGLVTIMVKGAVKSFFMSRVRSRHVSFIFRNPLSIMFGTITVIAMFLFFIYSVCLIFIESFSFISQIIIFCFVAVIVYPSVAFGYLFFFVVLLYYMVRLVKDFSDGYLELLSIAVEKSNDLYGQINHMSVFNGELLLTNVQVHEIRGIRVNDQRLDIPQNVLQRFNKGNSVKRIVEKDSIFGIPKRLFDVLVKVHRPVHIQVLKIFFQLVFVICLVIITMSITSKFATGATSEISDVMHVIFIVTVGALPRVLEVAFMNSSESLKREISIRRIEQTIKQFWLLEADDGFIIEA